MKKATCKKILIKRLKKSKLEIHLSFMHKNKFTCLIHECTNLRFFKIFSKNFFFPSKLHVNKCLYMYILDSYLKFK